MTTRRNFWAAAGLVLTPFGAVTDLTRTAEPWHGFQAQGAVLLVARAQKLQGPDVGRCEDWGRSLLSYSSGTTLTGAAAAVPGSRDWEAWEPWSKKETSLISDCEKIPCDVKLDAGEAAKLKAAPEAARRGIFLGLVAARVSRYEKTEARKEYEFPGDPVDPWAVAEKAGFVASLPRPPEPRPRARKLEFDPERMKVVRQVLDQRAASRTTGPSTTGMLWIRDVYSDHYFDGWGEWLRFDCDQEKQTLTLVQALVIELDMLKQTDLFSRLGRGKMKDATEEHGGRYLDHQFEALIPPKPAADKSGARPDHP